MSECNHNCESCTSKCAQAIEKEKLNAYSSVKKVYAVVSGKGGVGKSLVTGLLSALASKTQKTAILDADLTGPSIPKMFGIKDKALGCEKGIYPAKSTNGIDIMSINLLLEDETDPVVWRGPVLAGTVKQFWTEVLWENEDIMFIDMPPGTGDINLTVFQSLPINGIIVVTSPQELVGMIVEKAVKMASMLNIPIVGLVENMSYFICDKCNEKHYIYGQSNIDEIAKKYNIDKVIKLPFNKKFASLCDKGLIENAENAELEEFVKLL